MPPVGALLVDLDGTGCLQDVSEMPLDRLGEPSRERFDEAVDRAEMGLAAIGLREPHGPVAFVGDASAIFEALPGPVGGERCPGWRTA